MVCGANMVSALAAHVRDLTTEDLLTCAYLVRQETEARLNRAECANSRAAVVSSVPTEDGETVNLGTLRVFNGLQSRCVAHQRESR